MLSREEYLKALTYFLTHFKDMKEATIYYFRQFGIKPSSANAQQLKVITSLILLSRIAAKYLEYAGLDASSIIHKFEFSPEELMGFITEQCALLKRYGIDCDIRSLGISEKAIEESIKYAAKQAGANYKSAFDTLTGVSITLADLKKEAKKLKIRGYLKMTRTQLCEAIGGCY